MTEPDIIVALDDDYEVLEDYRRRFPRVFEQARPRRLALHSFVSDEAAVRFVARNHHRVLGYVQDLSRRYTGEDGPLEGIEFLHAVIRQLTPHARVIVRSAVPEWAEDVARADPNVRLISKYASDERFTQMIEWLIEPAVPVEEPSGDHSDSITPLIQVVSTPWVEIRRHLSMHPEELHRLHPRKFEELIAEVYRDYGWEVELTAATRDGGYDIVALRNNAPGQLKVLVEAKRYDPTNKIGVGIIRELYGVRQLRHASQVVLATSSYVSDDAKKEFRHVIPHELGLLERDALLDWCRRAGEVTVLGFAETRSLRREAE
jgi:hypothetical protein